MSSRLLTVKAPAFISAPAGEATRLWDWAEVARLLLTSRAIDELEEQELVPSGKVRYQFSARGHELAQILLALKLDSAHDAAAVYYRSRPFMLASGLTPEEALAATMARTGSPSGGRDIGVVFNMPSRGRATVLPATGDVGGQYTPATGWAQAICYRRETLGNSEWQGSIAVALGGEGSVVANGFWSALNIASTLALPLLFFIEDNGYAISVPSTLQTPGGDIAANLAAYKGVRFIEGDGTDPDDAAQKIHQALEHMREGEGPALLRLEVPRLNGHSFTDTQSYKDPQFQQLEKEHDPLPRLRDWLFRHGWSQQQWDDLGHEVVEKVRRASQRAETNAEPEPSTSRRFVFSQPAQPQKVGGLRSQPDLRWQAGDSAEISQAFAASSSAQPDLRRRASDSLSTTAPIERGERINMVDSIRRTLAHELRANPLMVIFGEDVGRKGGVHGATRDLQQEFGPDRVFDTCLSEEGIIGRAVGLALAGLLPVPEIQFRKYADPATEQINDCGTIRWRTNNNFAAPMVVRIPVGFSKAGGDPWHSVCAEAIFAHTIGWQVAFPSNAADAAGLLRGALRSNDPIFFLEHRALLDTADGRSPYPGDDYILPLGQAALRQSGDTLTVVTWGAMVQRCLEAAEPFAGAIEIVDLRTIAPWDRETVLKSVRKTGRCLVVHEDSWTCGFGAEIVATIAQQAFEWLDAPVSRLATPDCPIPYSLQLAASVIPSVGAIRRELEQLLGY